MNTGLTQTKIPILFCLVGLLSASSVSCGPEASNLPPEVFLNPDKPELTKTIGDTVSISVLAKDPEGSVLNIGWTHKTDNELSTVTTAEFISTAQTAEFRWTPDSADVTGDSPVRLIFFAEDEAGLKTEREIKLTLVPGNGTPRYDSTSNELYRKCCDDPLTFEVKWRDDDTERLMLTMQDAPVGATFEQTDSKKGVFTWKPSEAEAKKRIHGVTFVASDMQNDPVAQAVTIVIPPRDSDALGGEDFRMSNADVCAGENIIDHKIVPPQRPMTVGELEDRFTIEATLKKDAKRYDEAIIFWSEANPKADNMMMGEMSSVFAEQMTKEGNKLTGSFSNSAGFLGKTTEFFYKVCLFDTQAAADDKSAFLCVPTASNVYYTFKSYLDPADKCLDDGIEGLGSGNDSPETAYDIVGGQWQHFYSCDGNPDFYSVRVRGGQSAKLLISYPKDAQNLEFKLLDEQTQDISSKLKKSDCTGFITAELENTGSAPKFFYVHATGDEVSYYIDVVNMDSGGGCSDKAFEPNEDTSSASSLPLDAKIGDLDICPTGDDIDIYKLSLEEGQKITITMNHDSGASNLDTNLFPPSMKGKMLEKSGSGAVKFTFNIGEDDEVLEYDVRHCGEHYFMVFANDSGTPYSLETKIEAAACKDTDDFTCNHEQDRSELFAWNTTYNLKLCSKGEDWFKHKGGSAQILGEVKAVSGDISSMKFEIYDKDGMRIAEGKKNMAGNAIDIEHTFADDEMYYFRVTSSDDVDYELFVTN